MGRFELAADFYRQALKQQPANWVLLGEVSQFLTYSLRADPKAGVDLGQGGAGVEPDAVERIVEYAGRWAV